MLFLLLHLVLRLKEWLLKTKIYFFNLVDLSSNPLPQPSTFPTILNCNLEGRKSQTLVCDIYDILLRTHSFFPYFMLVSFEGGSIFRAFLLLSSCPILMFLSYEQKLKLMIFITFCGLKKKDMEMTSRVVLPKYYMENLNLKAYEVLVSFGCRVFFTNVPRVMVEGFLKEYLNGDDVIGSELHTIGCYFTGFISRNCFIDKQSALLDYFGDRKPHVGISSTCVNDHHFISFCKEAYVVSNEICPSSIMPRENLSKVSEILSPIRTMRLTRDKEQDRKTMQSLLSEGDLVVCPEGTTCREPYLLRFSSLFAELTDEIVPVALQAKVCLFYGTTASGLKSLDSVFFFMNPWPCYEVEILEKVPKEFTCGGGKCPYEVANYVQRELGNALGFESTNITRRDKYMMLAGNEGVVQKEK
ncbi:glycerol-3-phosphate acyltransferase 1-like isoform X2 [Cicer arietinum]|uniref:Glycerol-3-phosphate acyltransferase 1-like isoform X2 n=1 Tax=Cicer arietinum TaxID=3827 RepID=A0A3Q7WZG5_CICAR|nr:glycerol-3-phosphate acyltransferase 1-like isoform X2 [Cicer arietinum]